MGSYFYHFLAFLTQNSNKSNHFATFICLFFNLEKNLKNIDFGEKKWQSGYFCYYFTNFSYFSNKLLKKIIPYNEENREFPIKLLSFSLYSFTEVFFEWRLRNLSFKLS